MKYKVPSNIVNASKLLFRTIITNLGKSSEVGSRVGLSRQAIYNFEVEGYIPLKRVYSIAKKLELQVMHLSYFKIMEVFGEATPPLGDLVTSLAILSSQDKEKILKLLNKK